MFPCKYAQKAPFAKAFGRSLCISVNLHSRSLGGDLVFSMECVADRKNGPQRWMHINSWNGEYVT